MQWRPIQLKEIVIFCLRANVFPNQIMSKQSVTKLPDLQLLFYCYYYLGFYYTFYIISLVLSLVYLRKYYICMRIVKVHQSISEYVPGTKLLS